MRGTPPGGNRRSKRTAIQQILRSGKGISDVRLLAEDTGYTFEEWYHPDNALKRSFDEFGFLVDQALSGVDLTPDDAAAMNQMLATPASTGLPNQLLLSNRQIRKQGYKLLYRTLRAQWRGPAGGRRRWFFGTVITDMGNALEYRPVIEMARLQRDFRKAMVRSGLNCFALIEVQGGTNYPQGRCGRTLMTHAHFIGYTYDPTFGPRAATRRARAGSTLHNWLGAPTFKIRPIRTRSALRRSCYYLFKMPVRGSRLSPDDQQASGFTTVKNDIDRMMALRLVELLAQLDYREASFATGAGVQLKGDWLRAMAAWHVPRASNYDVDVRALFERVWEASRTRASRAPFDIRWDTSHQLSPAWGIAMDAKFDLVAANRRAYEQRQALRSRGEK